MTFAQNTQLLSKSQTQSKQDMIRESSTINTITPAYLNYNYVKNIDCDLALPVMARDYKGFGTGHDAQNGVIECTTLQ